MLHSRRQFLSTAAAAAAAVAAHTDPNRAIAEDAPPILDSHVHLWQLDRFKLPWLTADSPLHRSFTLEDYRALAEPLGITQAIYLEVDVEPAQQQAEVDWIISLLRSKNPAPFVAAVVSGRPASPGFEPYIRRVASFPEIKGIRQVLHVPSTPPDYPLQPDFLKGMRLLGSLGLSFDICPRGKDLDSIEKLVASAPDTTFILDHCGNPSLKDSPADRELWKSRIDRLARLPNLAACKLSGFPVTSAPGRWTIDQVAPVLNHVLDAFGPERVLFAGDWPVCNLAGSLAGWLGAVQAVMRDRPAHHHRMLFYENAHRVYRLDT
jgi:L-fuconolactonase